MSAGENLAHGDPRTVVVDDTRTIRVAGVYVCISGAHPLLRHMMALTDQLKAPLLNDAVRVPHGLGAGDQLRPEGFQPGAGPVGCVCCLLDREALLESREPCALDGAEFAAC